jgi:ferredoxin like protein
MSDNKDIMTLEDKLYRTKYEPDTDNPHIVIANEKLTPAEAKALVTLCPAGVYKPDPNNDKEILVSHDNCLECGTCTKICNLDALDWKFPDGAMGVKFRIG